jgi:uncharacterized protein YndB with AHSA1/START domain
MASLGIFPSKHRATTHFRKELEMSYSSATSLFIHATRERVWRALTEPALVKQYLFGTTLETTWQIGAPLTFRGEWEGKAYEDRGTVLAFEPMRALAYDYWSSFSGLEDRPELRQVIRFELEEQTDGVKLSVQQTNVDSQARADHSGDNWRSVLTKLKELVET